MHETLSITMAEKWKKKIDTECEVMAKAHIF